MEAPRPAVGGPGSYTSSSRPTPCGASFATARTTTCLRSVPTLKITVVASPECPLSWALCLWLAVLLQGFMLAWLLGSLTLRPPRRSAWLLGAQMTLVLLQRICPLL